MAQTYVATGFRALRLESLSQPEYRSRDSSNFLSLKNFYSPQLIDDILQSLSIPAVQTSSYPQRIRAIINKVEDVFNLIINDINQVKVHIIARLASFPEECLTNEIQGLIRKELEKCRQKVINSDFSAKVLDEFATLVCRYRDLYTKSSVQLAGDDQLDWMLNEIHDNIKEYFEDFKGVIAKIKGDILQFSKGKPQNELKELKRLEEENNLKKFDYLLQEETPAKAFKTENWIFASKKHHQERKLATHISLTLESNQLGILALIQNKEYLVLLSSPDSPARLSDLMVCDKDSRKYLRRKVFMPRNDDDDEDDEAGVKKLIYLEKLNLILVFDGQKINLFSITKNKLSRIAIIKKAPSRFIECIPKASKIMFVYTSRASDHPTTIEVMDILTRQVVQQKRLEKPTSDCLYMENRDSFVIVSKDILLIYKITKTGCIGSLLIQIPIETAYNTGSRISCQGNLLVVRENYLQPGRKGIELPYERFQLILLDKRNKYQYEKCEVCTKDELWGESRGAVVVPGLNKLLISFNEMGESLVELNMKKKITKLLDKEDYLELKDYRILAKSDGGDRLIIAKKDGIYEWIMKI